MTIKLYFFAVLFLLLSSCSQPEEAKVEVDPDRLEYERAMKKLGATENPADVRTPEPIDMSDTAILQLLQEHHGRGTFESDTFIQIDSNKWKRFSKN